MSKLKQALFIAGIKDGEVDEYSTICPESLIIDGEAPEYDRTYKLHRLSGICNVYTPKDWTVADLLLALTNGYIRGAKLS